MEIPLKSDNENTSTIKHYVGMSMNQMRHLEIDRLIEDKAVRSLLDLGCSEGLLLQKLGRCEKLELLVGVDIEETALSHCILNTFPENIQQTIQYSRQHDQQIYIYQGDATKKYKRLKDFNAELVTLVELIEHLHPQQIPKAVENVFGYLQPKYCFVSTPNREFNSFFQFEESQLRHWDHKFEWDRAQFQQFCQAIQDKYNYTFVVNGVGEHVSDSTKGHCTQYAVFTREGKEVQREQVNCEYGELVEKAHYCNHSWRNNMDKIMRGLLFKSLYYNQAVTFEEGVQFLKGELIGGCLAVVGTPVDQQFIVKYLEMNSEDFEWDSAKYHLKKTIVDEAEEEHEEQAQFQGVGSHFSQPLSKSSYELSISESYQRKPLEAVPLQE